MSSPFANRTFWQGVVERAAKTFVAEMGVDIRRGEPMEQFRRGRITLVNGTVLERGGTLSCVWAVSKLPESA